MSAMASQVTGVSIVCSAACLGTDRREHQSSASLDFVKGIPRWPGGSSQKVRNAANVFIWWRYHDQQKLIQNGAGVTYTFSQKFKYKYTIFNQIQIQIHSYFYKIQIRSQIGIKYKYVFDTRPDLEIFYPKIQLCCCRCVSLVQIWARESLGTVITKLRPLYAVCGTCMASFSYRDFPFIYRYMYFEYSNV